MRINECSCGCGGSGECGGKELDSYMFFGNLQTIKRAIDALLEMDPSDVDQILNDGHDWAADHIATSKDDIQEVAEFFINKMGQESSEVRMMGMDSRLMDTHAIKTFESFLNEAKKVRGKKKKDQDQDGDNDFADVKIAQYMAGGMSRAEAIAKSRKFNKMNEDEIGAAGSAAVDSAISSLKPGALYTTQHAHTLLKKEAVKGITGSDIYYDLIVPKGAKFLAEKGTIDSFSYTHVAKYVKDVESKDRQNSWNKPLFINKWLGDYAIYCNSNDKTFYATQLNAYSNTGYIYTEENDSLANALAKVK